MTEGTSRTVFRDELDHIEQATLAGLDYVRGIVRRTIAALTSSDVDTAAEIVAGDIEVDRIHRDVTKALLQLLALEAPVATELRVAAALLHTVRHIERIGDQCVNISKLIPLAGHSPPTDPSILARLERMGEQADRLLDGAHIAFATRDLERAESLPAEDQLINMLNREIFRIALEMGSTFDEREWATLMMLASRCIERIGDNAVDIGEHVVFIVTGEFREFAHSSSPAGIESA